MPRVTEAHRRARRDEIAEAALRVLQERGVSNTSIAQIVTESGLSAGAIYANFENKAELARYVARSLLSWRVDLVAAEGDADAVRTPLEVLDVLLGTMDEAAPPLPVVVQFWGEAATDTDLHAVLTEKVSELRAAFEHAVRPWAAARSADAAGADALVAHTATTLIVLAQGYLANVGLLGWTSRTEFMAGLGALLR